jgi:hypothetical protein
MKLPNTVFSVTCQERVALSSECKLHTGKFKINISKNCKDKVHPIKDNESPKGELRYSSTLSLTSALDGVVS